MAVTTKRGKNRDVSNSKELEGQEEPREQEDITSDMDVEQENTPKIKGLERLDFSSEDAKVILRQVDAEYKFGTGSSNEWVDKNLKRLKLYNNQKRDDEYVGEPLLYTHMNTWLASLYDDELDREWIPREDGDITTAENLSDLSEYDFELMDKSTLDYSIKWDALFFGYALVDMIEFDVDKKCPIPSLIDPFSFYYDSLSSTIDGNANKRGGMRFLGWEMFISKLEIEESSLFYENAIDLLGKSKEDHPNSNVEKARRERIEAQGSSYKDLKDNDLGDNTIYTVIQHRTMWKGHKIILLLDQKKENILGAVTLPLDENDKSISWWVVAYLFSPEAHQFKGVSIPDLIEDKQRKKAVLVNDSLNLTRDTTYGSYMYDFNKIQNTGDLKWGFDKYVPVDGNPNDVIVPIRKDAPDMVLLTNMLDYLDVSAQTATATPSLQQGVLSEQQRTLGELNLVAQSTKTRYSLALKSMASSDKKFWGLYYLSLKVYWKEGIGEKVVRISGATRSFRTFTSKDVLCTTDPDVQIVSKSLAEMNRLKKFNQYVQVLELVLQDPDADKRTGEKHAMELAGLDRDEIDGILPPSSDELIARDQNEMINQEKMPPLLMNDNHLVHLRVHREATENKYKRIHMSAHLEAMRILQEKPELLPQQTEAGMQEGQTPANGATATAGGQVPITRQQPSQQANLSNNAI